jgi:hypothetical protein
MLAIAIILAQLLPLPHLQAAQTCPATLGSLVNTFRLALPR